MKNDFDLWVYQHPMLKKLILELKIAIILIVAGVSSVFATTSYSQIAKVSLDMKNSNIGQVLDEIKRQSEFYFVFDLNQIDVNRVVDVKADNKLIDDVLAEIFSGTNVSFIVADRKISLTTSTGIADQQRKITGKVTDKAGQPLIGVGVIVKGTTVGALTDIDGNYTLTLPEGATALTFSFIGMTPQEIAIGPQTSINVVLQEDAIGLEEVVVIGYGSVKRKDLTGSVSSVSEEKITDRPVSRLDQALIGAIPGLDIITSGGTPGASTSILLRGKRSFSASNAPLIIVDGMTFYGDINDLNPADVKSIDVLKDASSTSIYGSRGANGVIMITTKTGQVSKPKFSFDSYAGPEIRYGYMPVANGPQYAEWTREAYRATGGYNSTTTDPALDALIFDVIELPTVTSGGQGQRYQDDLFRNGFQERHQLGVNGGTEAVRYSLTAGYLHQEGIMPDDMFNRISMNTKIDVTISPKVTAGTSIQLSYNANSQKSNRAALSYAFNGDPLGQLILPDGSINFQLTTDSYEINPMVDYWYDSYRAQGKNYSAFINAYADYKITPHLTYRVSVGTNARLGTSGDFTGYYSISTNKGLPKANVSERLTGTNSYESTLTYNKTFNENHNLTVTAVQGIQTQKQESQAASVQDLPYETSRFYNIGTANTVNAVSSGLQEWALLSYVGRINYGYKSKYLATVSMRVDGASQLAEGHKWGYFPAVSLAYRISQEKFMEGTKNWLQDLKIRLSYGVTGNQAISPYQTQGSLTRTTYAWNEANGFGYRPLTFANKNLKWESTGVYNFGLDFALIKGRISGSIDLYNTHTYDLLMYRKLPVTTGFDQVLENVGSTSNKGLEMSIHSTNISKNGFDWKTDLSFSANRTKIDELYSGKVDDIGNRWFIGQPINVFYDYEKIGIWQLDEAAEAAKYGETVGQIKVKDQQPDNKHNSDDMVILGNPDPKWIANISNQFKYKNFDLGFTVYVRWGGMTSVGNFAPYSKKRYNKFIFDYWTPTNPTNAYPRPNQLYDNAGGLWGTTLTYRDASYIRVSTASFGYSLPKSILTKIKISSARVYFTTENPFYWTASELRKFNMKPDFAPTRGTTDITDTYSTGTYPATRTFVLGVNLVF
jgi:TonB-linked SusC/RagA family outer membrane protein